ncbi:MAG: hypothetical protein GY822_21695 [Deltaproteobacteria bacterium]|nr:hypothetical protein [Deltaproteobacteria bacterium]
MAKLKKAYDPTLAKVSKTVDISSEREASLRLQLAELEKAKMEKSEKGKERGAKE